MILLDTHVLLWLSGDPQKLSEKAAAAIRAGAREGGIGIAAISLWEIAWLATHGRLEITGTPDVFVERITSRAAILPITTKIAVLANQLPASYSHDPADRLIGATSLAEGIPLVTKDRNIRGFNQIRTIW